MYSEDFLRFEEEVESSPMYYQSPSPPRSPSWDLVHNPSRSPPRSPMWDLVQSPLPLTSPNRNLVLNPMFRFIEIVDISSSPEPSETIEIFSSPEVEILPTPEKKQPELVDLVSPPETTGKRKRDGDDDDESPKRLPVRRRLLYSSDEDDYDSEFDGYHPDDESPGRLVIST